MMKVAAAALLLLLLATTAAAQHFHPPQDAELHDRFYSTWFIAPKRVQSCCNKLDCYPAPIRRANGAWYFLHRESQQWLSVPEDKLEHNQADPRDSPDGRSHICANQKGYVFCAVLGGGQ